MDYCSRAIGAEKVRWKLAATLRRASYTMFYFHSFGAATCNNLHIDTYSHIIWSNILYVYIYIYSYVYIYIYISVQYNAKLSYDDSGFSSKVCCPEPHCLLRFGNSTRRWSRKEKEASGQQRPGPGQMGTDPTFRNGWLLVWKNFYFFIDWE